MLDPRLDKLAKVLVHHSARVQPGELVAIQADCTAQPLIEAVFEETVRAGGHPHLLLDIPALEEIFMSNANEEQLAFSPLFHKLVAERFDARIVFRGTTNTRALSAIDPARQAARGKALQPIMQTIMQRGGEGSLKWIGTLYPTEAYAQDAEMSLRDYENFYFRACHVDADTLDPIAYWQGVQKEQQQYVDRIEGRDRVQVRGPNCELNLSIEGRKFRNASGQHNMPDGEIYTAPVEDSVNGWVRFTYPAITNGRSVEGIELKFEAGRVVQATAKKNEDYLIKMLDTDDGARTLGEFAIGTNYGVDRFTGTILFDEKIGGTIHMAVGAGYPETGSRNLSAVHWDMICDMRDGSEILVDGEVVYRNGRFQI